MSLFGSIFGGGSKSTVVSTQNTTVNVETNPQFDVAIDLDVAPIADAIASGDVALADALRAQAGAVITGFEQLGNRAATAIGETGSKLLAAAVVGFILFRVVNN